MYYEYNAHTMKTQSNTPGKYRYILHSTAHGETHMPTTRMRTHENHKSTHPSKQRNATQRHVPHERTCARTHVRIVTYCVR